MEWKRCSKCHDLKPIDNFYRKKKDEEDRVSECKECAKKYRAKNKERRKAYDKKYQQANKERKSSYRKVYYQEHKEELRIYNAKYREEHREEINEWNREYARKRSEERKPYRKEYYQKNKKRLNAQKNEYMKQKFQEDPNFRLKRNVSRAIADALQGRKSGRRTEDLIGYKISELKEHLEFQFSKNMSWENYGSYWQVDHIIPVRVYNFFDENEIKKCWDRQNLRPLESIKNSSKGGKLDINLIKEYNIIELLPDILLVE